MSVLAEAMLVDMVMVADGVRQHMVLAGVVATDMAMDMVAVGEEIGLVQVIMATLQQPTMRLQLLMHLQ
jgi:hypothetical protein